VLGFCACTCFEPAPPAPSLPLGFSVPYSGSGSTSLDQLTISDDASYRIHVSSAAWFEPTAGAQFTHESYSQSAAALGLSDGHTFRLDGGARVGMDALVGQTLVTTSLTGLAFEDLVVTGDSISGGAFGPHGNILSDQGVLQGAGILAVNLDFGHEYLLTGKASCTVVQEYSAPPPKPAFACSGRQIKPPAHPDGVALQRVGPVLFLSKVTTHKPGATSRSSVSRKPSRS
jgi:hypothetical protein